MQATDAVIAQIAEYAVDYEPESELALDTARLCLMDSIGCALLALNYPACTRLLGPDVPGTVVPDGSRVPGTGFQLDPVKAAFDTGATIRSTTTTPGLPPSGVIPPTISVRSWQ